jgi:hypothetical protein
MVCAWMTASHRAHPTNHHEALTCELKGGNVPSTKWRCQAHVQAQLCKQDVNQVLARTGSTIVQGKDSHIKQTTQLHSSINAGHC